MKRTVIILALGWLGICSSISVAIPPDELPFGSMYLYPDDYADTLEVIRLADDMRFNYFVEYRNVLNSTNIGRLYDYGIQSIRGGLYNSLSDAEAPTKYSWSNYALVNVDSTYPSYEVRMEKFGGRFENGMWVAPRDSAVTLSGISTYQSQFSSLPNRVAFFDKYLLALHAGDKIRYRLDFFAAIDDPDTTSTEIVATATILVGMWNTCEMKAVYVDSLLVTDFGSSSSLQWIDDDTTFVIPDSFTVVDWDSGSCDDTTFYTNLEDGVNKRWQPYVELDINTTGVREVKIDSIKISDDDGRRLIEGHERDDAINIQFQQYVTSGDTAKIYGWMLMDEPLYTNFLPFRYIDELMQDVYSGWVTFTDNWHFLPARTISRSYLDVVAAEYLNPDIYPYLPSDCYAGNSFQDSTADSGGPLFRFNNSLSWVREAVDEKNKDFWVTIQAFDNTVQRFPTGPEMSCNVFMALCWGSQGIQFFYYDTHLYPDQCGIRNASQDTTGLYNQIKDHLGPYIQAFDEYYMPLSWDTAYTYHSTAPVHDPPAGAYVESASYRVHPDSVNMNPDAGWFHIGEFHDESAKYVLLVNRACSRGASDPTPAPSVTATVKFDASELGWNYIYIIDLAGSLRLAGADTGWVGIPDTTYSATMPDGTIPFTTVLGPGEGRLYKIVETDRQ